MLGAFSSATGFGSINTSLFGAWSEGAAISAWVRRQQIALAEVPPAGARQETPAFRGAVAEVLRSPGAVCREISSVDRAILGTCEENDFGQFSCTGIPRIPFTFATQGKQLGI